jgi:hypothetical protein
MEKLAKYITSQNLQIKKLKKIKKEKKRKEKPWFGQLSKTLCLLMLNLIMMQHQKIERRNTVDKGKCTKFKNNYDFQSKIRTTI